MTLSVVHGMLSVKNAKVIVYKSSGPGSKNNTYEKLFSPSSNNPPNIQYMIDNELPLEKIVMGACSYPECYNNDNCDDGDFVTASTLMDFINTFSPKNNIRGIMFWQLYPTGNYPSSCNIGESSYQAPHGMTGYDWISTYYNPNQ